MPLVPESVIQEWYHKESIVYRNFAYLFQNPIWHKPVPTRFCVCPYFWGAIFLSPMFRIFVVWPYVLFLFPLMRLITRISNHDGDGLHPIFEKMDQAVYNFIAKFNENPKTYTFGYGITHGIAELFLILIVLLWVGFWFFLSYATAEQVSDPLISKAGSSFCYFVAFVFPIGYIFKKLQWYCLNTPAYSRVAVSKYEVYTFSILTGVWILTNLQFLGEGILICFKILAIIVLEIIQFFAWVTPIVVNAVISALTAEPVVDFTIGFFLVVGLTVLLGWAMLWLMIYEGNKTDNYNTPKWFTKAMDRLFGADYSQYVQEHQQEFSELDQKEIRLQLKRYTIKNAFLKGFRDNGITEDCVSKIMINFAKFLYKKNINKIKIEDHFEGYENFSKLVLNRVLGLQSELKYQIEQALREDITKLNHLVERFLDENNENGYWTNGTSGLKKMKLDIGKTCKDIHERGIDNYLKPEEVNLHPAKIKEHNESRIGCVANQFNFFYGLSNNDKELKMDFIIDDDSLRKTNNKKFREKLYKDLWTLFRRPIEKEVRAAVRLKKEKIKSMEHRANLIEGLISPVFSFIGLVFNIVANFFKTIWAGIKWTVRNTWVFICYVWVLFKAFKKKACPCYEIGTGDKINKAKI